MKYILFILLMGAHGGGVIEYETYPSIQTCLNAMKIVEEDFRETQRSFAPYRVLAGFCVRERDSNYY